MAQTKEQLEALFLKAPVEKVHVPEWECDVYIKSLNAQDRELFETQLQQMKTEARLRASVVAGCLCDELGKKIYDSIEDGVAKLLQVSSVIIIRLFDIAMRLSGIEKEEQQAEQKN